MKTRIGALQLKLRGLAGTTGENSVQPGEWAAAELGPLGLAMAIASRTVSNLVEAEMLNPVVGAQQLRDYSDSLNQGRIPNDCILRFLFPEGEELSMGIVRLNRRVQLHVWEMAHRIAPPKSFYKAHPEILEACKLCGAAILDAGTPSTLTTGSINPLAGDFLASWMESVLAIDPSELRPRFFFHVIVPPPHWEAIARSHFRVDYGI
jgi:hypothetical protein